MHVYRERSNSGPIFGLVPLRGLGGDVKRARLIRLFTYIKETFLWFKEKAVFTEVSVYLSVVVGQVHDNSIELSDWNELCHTLL